MKILILDNYDSFTYNLVHLVEKIIHQKVDVFRNDKITLEQVSEYDRIILSPGPGIPSEAGLLLQLVKEFAHCKSILGVCLGHQAIGEAFGARLVNLSTVFHGVATPIMQTGITNSERKNNLFSHLPAEIEAGRYHSWIISEEDFPEELTITAKDENG